MTTDTISTIRSEWNQAVKDATIRALCRYPDETTRIVKGMAIVHAEGVQDTSEGVYVDSQTREGVQYKVKGTCPCYDAAKAPEGRCKHRWAKALYTKAVQHQHETLAAIDAALTAVEARHARFAYDLYPS